MARETFRDKRGGEARALFDQGLSCNEIARRMGVGAATISRWAEAEGLAFDRAQTAKANTAKAVDIAAIRAEIAAEMGLAARELLATRNQPYEVFAFGGRDNSFNSEMLDKPPVEAVRNIVTTAGIAFDKATKFLETSGDGESEAKSLLADLGRALGIGSFS